MKNLILCTLLILELTCNAQPGSIDTTFNPNDAGFGDGVNNMVRATAIQNDGKIIIGGFFTSYNETACNHIARLNADGSLDTTFNIGTGADNRVHTISIQSDGKIIIGGWFTSYNGTVVNRIARLNTNGTLDVTFNTGTGADGWVQTSAIQSDGKIIVGGFFGSYNGTASSQIARLNTDGSLDATFNVGTGADGAVWATAIQTDGKIIIAGDFSSYNGASSNRIARLNSNGSIDNTFVPGTGADNTIKTTSIQNDGKIIIGGGFMSYNETAINCIARLNTDGSLDTSFNIGSGAGNIVYATSIQNDGKIIIGGLFTSYNDTFINHIVRLNANGSIDTTFNIGSGVNNSVYVASIQNDGKIIIAGGFTSFNGIAKRIIIRINTNGSLDASFMAGTGANNLVFSTSVQSDGKIIIAGDFTTYNGTIINRIVRLNPDGSIDTLFDTGMGANSLVGAVAIQNDGKIIFAGSFTSYNETSKNFIARLNADGSIDTTFNTGSGASDPVWATAIQSDGKIIIGGYFTSYNDIAINHIARLNTDSSLDTTFNTGTGTNGSVLTTAIQSDGKIIIVGGFSSYNGTSIKNIARLNTDGSLDTTFNTGTGPNGSVFTTAIQSDGKIIITGYFTSFNGTPINSIARLNTDGSIDPTLNPGSGANDNIYSIAIQNDGKIIIAGNYTSYNGAARNRLARLNTDGSLDVTFNVGTGANNYIYTTALQSDGKIIIGGEFTSYDGTGRNRVARILGDTVVSIGSITANNETLLYPNPSGDYVTIVAAEKSNIEIVSIHGQTVKSLVSTDSKTIVDLSGLVRGVYMISIRNDKEIVVRKLIKQ